MENPSATPADELISAIMARSTEEKQKLKFEIHKVVYNEVTRKLGLAGAHAVAE